MPIAGESATKALRAQHAEIARLKRERHHIYDLLARIHRDGGQYTADHGVEKSCDDAEAQVVTWLDTLSSVDALIEQARIAEREACAALRSFAQAVMDCWPDGWGIEGDDLQRIATEHGMLRPEIRNEPCGDGCRCADHVLPNEWRDGVVCYRKTALLTGADK